MKKKLVAMLLAVVMAVSLLPETAWAIFVDPNAGGGNSRGICGENLTWSYSNGVLTISGTGLIDEYDPFFPLPPGSTY